LLAYNKARFDHWLEFGLKYQLNTLPLRTSPAYLPLNLYSYLLRPMGYSCRFPFVSALREIGLRGFPSGTRFPPGYTTPEPLAGLLMSAPWTWLVLLVPILAIVALVRRRARGGGLSLDRVARGRLWMAGAFVVLGGVTLLPAIAAFSATMRYLADISTGFVLLATGAAWMVQVDAAVQGRAWARRSWTILMILLALMTIVFGLLLGVQGYDDMFLHQNPALYRTWVRALSFCRG
jgi:hypothetical protein